MNKDFDSYWKRVGGAKRSNDFKDLIQKMFSKDGNERPTIEELKQHPWVTMPISMKLTRSQILDQLEEKKCDSTTQASSSTNTKNHIIEEYEQFL